MKEKLASFLVNKNTEDIRKPLLEYNSENDASTMKKKGNSLRKKLSSMSKSIAKFQIQRT